MASALVDTLVVLVHTARWAVLGIRTSDSDSKAKLFLNALIDPPQTRNTTFVTYQTNKT
jgi:hypothetical protein